MPHSLFACDTCHRTFETATDAVMCESEHVKKEGADVALFLKNLKPSSLGWFVKLDELDYDRVMQALCGPAEGYVRLHYNGVPIYKVGDSTPGEVCLTTEEAKALFDFLVKAAGSDIYSTTTTVLSALRKLS